MTPDQIVNFKALPDATLLLRDLVDANLVPSLESQIDKAKAAFDAAVTAAVAKAADELKAATDPLNAQVTALTATVAERDITVKTMTAQIEWLTKDVADATAKITNMEGHPDVIAFRRAAAIAQAKAEIAAGKATLEGFGIAADDIINQIVTP